MGANGVLKLFCWCSWIFHDFIHNVGHCVTKVPTRNVERKSVPEQICVIRFQNEFHVKRVPNKMPGESKVNNAGLCLYPHRICVYILSPTKASQSGLADFFFFSNFFVSLLLFEWIWSAGRHWEIGVRDLRSERPFALDGVSEILFCSTVQNKLNEEANAKQAFLKCFALFRYWCVCSFIHSWSLSWSVCSFITHFQMVPLMMHPSWALMIHHESSWCTVSTHDASSVLMICLGAPIEPLLTAKLP